MMVYQEKGKKFRFYTRVTIKGENWVKNSFKPISLEDFEIKEKFATCEMLISGIEKESIFLSRVLSVEEMAVDFRLRIKKTNAFKGLGSNHVNEIRPGTQSDFLDHFDDFIDQSKATIAIGII
jgi:hypothetical protein